MSIFTSIAVSPSGSTLLNALQVTTAAGTVLNEGVTLVDSANPANVGSILASGAMLVEPGGVNSQPVTGTVTANQATAANLNATVVGPAASGATATGNPIRNGEVFNTTQPTVTTGQIVDLQSTARGGLIVATGADTFTAAITSSSAQTITAVQATPANLTATVSQGATAWVDNLTQVAGTALGATAVVNFGAAPAAVVVPAVNTALVNVAGTAVTTAGAGTQKVGIVGNGGSPCDGTVVAGTAPIHGFAILTEYVSAAPAPTTGQTVSVQCDAWGNTFVRPFRRSGTIAQATTITNSSVATTVLAAQAAGIFADISNLIITVTPAATTDLAFTASLSDGTATYIFDMDTGALATATTDPTQINVNFNPPLPATTAATAWTITLSLNTVTVHITVVSVQQKAS